MSDIRKPVSLTPYQVVQLNNGSIFPACDVLKPGRDGQATWIAAFPHGAFP